MRINVPYFKMKNGELIVRKNSIVRLIMVLSLLLYYATICPKVAEALGAQPQLHRVDQFRVLYYTEGEHAIPLEDKNKNRIPDYAENVLIQTQAAHRLFVEILGFPDPFKSKSFHRADFLDIIICAQEVAIADGGLGGKKGIAFDRLQTLHLAGDPENTLSINFRVASTGDIITDHIPTREFFHLIQYGVTSFRNQWFIEGTAYWSQYGLSKYDPVRSKIQRIPWPLSTSETTDLFAMKEQAAEKFWLPIAAQMNKKGVIPFTSALHHIMPLAYANEQPVLKNMRFPGWMFIRDVLVELGRVDDIAFRELEYQEWSEENQVSLKNDQYILQAVNTVMIRYKAALGL